MIPSLRTRTFTALFVLLGSAALSSGAVAQSNEQAEQRVLTSLPITHGLSSALLKDTRIQVERAAPAKLPGSRQPSYFSGRGSARMAELATAADAVIGVRSLWPQDPLYPQARRSNIRVVEVDAAYPVDGVLPGVALRSSGENGLDSQPWLASSNLGRMADIIAADLVRLAPSQSEAIEANLAEIKQRLLKLTAANESRLIELDNLSVVTLADGFNYLIAGLNLDHIILSEGSSEDMRQLGEQLTQNDVAVVISDKVVTPEVQQAITASGAQLTVLDQESEDPIDDLAGKTDALISALERAGQ